MMQNSVKPEALERQRHPPWMLLELWTLPAALWFIGAMHFNTLVLRSMVPRSAAAE